MAAAATAVQGVSPPPEGPLLDALLITENAGMGIRELGSDAYHSSDYTLSGHSSDVSDSSDDDDDSGAAAAAEFAYFVNNTKPTALYKTKRGGGKTCLKTWSGKIKARKGPMGSGKSEWLIGRLKHFSAAGRKVRGFSPTINTREELIRSRNGDTHDCVRTKRLMCQVDSILDDDVRVVGIDEAHFFEDLYEFCTLMASFGILVLLAYLNGDYLHKPWKSVVPLMAEMEEDIMLHSPCFNCPYGVDTMASFTIRTRLIPEAHADGDENVSTIGGDGDQTPLVGDIGEDALYIPVCRQCRFLRDPYTGTL